MTERPFTPPGDDDLDTALRARRRLLPRFDTHVDDEPSPELDRLVLSRAREALRPDAAPERHYRSPRWAAPVAIAATVLLSLGLVLQLDPSRNDAVLDTGSTMTAATAITDAQSADAAASAESAASVAAAAAPAPQIADAAAVARSTGPAARATRSSEFVADVAAERAPLDRARAEKALTEDAIANLRKEAAPVGAAADVAASADEATAEVAGVAATAAAPRPAAVAAPPAAATRTAIPRDDPRRWLAAIEQLRDVGETDAARRELAAFRLRHPDLPLPESLDALR